MECGAVREYEHITYSQSGWKADQQQRAYSGIRTRRAAARKQGDIRNNVRQKLMRVCGQAFRSRLKDRDDLAVSMRRRDCDLMIAGRITYLEGWH